MERAFDAVFYPVFEEAFEEGLRGCLDARGCVVVAEGREEGGVGGGGGRGGGRPAVQGGGWPGWAMPAPPTMALPCRGLEGGRGEGDKDGNRDVEGCKWCIGFEYKRFDEDFMSGSGMGSVVRWD